MNFDAWNCRYDQILNISSFFHNEKVKLYLFCVDVSLLLCYHDNWLIWVIFIKQTIETDVAMAATTFSIGVSTYLVICNYGNIRRYETKSRLYRVNPDSSLLVVNWRIANLLWKDYENCKENLTISFNPWIITVVLLFCRANLHFWFCKVSVGRYKMFQMNQLP